MKIKILTCVFCLFIMSCGGHVCKYDELAFSLMNNFSKEIKDRKNLKVIATGGSMTRDIEVLDLHIISNQIGDIPSARKIYVETVEELVKKVNDNKEIRSYLHDYPFSDKNIKIMISFEDKTGAHINGCVALVTKSHGVIYYSTFDPLKTDGNRYIDLFKEPYEEALRIVNEQK